MTARTLIMAASLAALATTGCDTIMPGETVHPLVARDWRLAEIQRPSQPVTRLPTTLQARHTMRFASDGTVQMKLDCNQGNSTWQAPRPLDGRASLTIGEIASTRALCPTPSYGEEMAANLPLSSAYALSPDGKRLEIMARTGTYVFVAY